MLIKRKNGEASRGKFQAITAGMAIEALDRRSFLARSGLAIGGVAAVGSIQLGAVRKAKAIDGPKPGVETVIKKNICTHCSVGCTVTAEVQNGVWTGQEPSWASPINRGTHCAKGAAIRETVSGERRLKYPLRLVSGQWQRISWDQAINEIGDKLMDIRGKHGADAVFWLGSAKFSNEGAYLMRKFGAFWGTNSIDHQARICHSTTVAGVANTWGYGAQTNSYNDIPQRQDHDHHGRQPGRGAPGGDAACACREGNQPRQHDRYRPAVHSHRGARHRICPHPLRHRHSGDLGDAVAHLPEWLGGQGVHPPARLRHG